MRRILLLIFALSVAATARSQGTIDDPREDEIVRGPDVLLRGTAPPATNVVLRVNGTVLTVPVAGSVWTAVVPLVAGLNVIDATLGSQSKSFAVTRAANVSSRQNPQRVRLHWKQGVDGALQQIASDTMTKQRMPNGAIVSRSLTAREQQEFVDRVKPRVAELFAEAFQSAGSIMLTMETDHDVHVVTFTSENLNQYGEQLPDCGNRISGEESKVSVGYLHHRLTFQFSDWKPMELTDELDVRIEDVARSLARTAAHETGHALGLVLERGDCGWMHGCDDFHTCQLFQLSNPAVNRFGSGRFIMDPAGATRVNMRLGESTDSIRGNSRTSPVFSNFDRSYLRFIQPKAGN